MTILCGAPKVASGLVKGGIIRTAKSTGGPRYSIVPSGGTKGTQPSTQSSLLTKQLGIVVTEYQVLSTWQHKTWGELSAVAMRAVTGRQHQLRATAAALGCPILGDRRFVPLLLSDVAGSSSVVSTVHFSDVYCRYGGKSAPRVMLHASFTGFLARVGKPYHVLCPPDWDLIDGSLPTCEAYLRSIPPLKPPI